MELNQQPCRDIHMTHIDHLAVKKVGVKGPPFLCNRIGSLGTITPLWYYIKMGVPLQAAIFSPPNDYGSYESPCMVVCSVQFYFNCFIWLKSALQTHFGRPISRECPHWALNRIWISWHPKPSCFCCCVEKTERRRVAACVEVWKKSDCISHNLSLVLLQQQQSASKQTAVEAAFLSLLMGASSRKTERVDQGCLDFFTIST